MVICSWTSKVKQIAIRCAFIPIHQPLKSSKNAHINKAGYPHKFLLLTSREKLTTSEQNVCNDIAKYYTQL